MSDIEANRIFSGNSTIQPTLDGHGCEHAATPRPLAEECISISLADLRQLFGRRELMKAAQDARPVHFEMLGNAFSIRVLAVPHRLPSGRFGLSDREVTRLWICCFGCRRKVRKVYTCPKFAGSSTLIMPSCRQCLGLTYQSQNCGGNRWWRETARPLKRLLRRRERLRARKPSAKVEAQLQEVDRLIWILRQRAKPKSSARRRLPQSTGAKRPYRDLDPILQSLPC